MARTAGTARASGLRAHATGRTARGTGIVSASALVLLLAVGWLAVAAILWRLVADLEGTERALASQGRVGPAGSAYGR
jgi:hypothetical protein